MICDLKVLRDHEENELFTDISEFTSQFYMIVRCGSCEWSESSIKSDLDM